MAIFSLEMQKIESALKKREITCTMVDSPSSNSEAIFIPNIDDPVFSIERVGGEDSIHYIRVDNPAVNKVHYKKYYYILREIYDSYYEIETLAQLDAFLLKTA